MNCGRCYLIGYSIFNENFKTIDLDWKISKWHEKLAMI